MADMNLKQLAAYFGHVGDLLGNYDVEPILDKLRNRLVQVTEANFSGRHAPDGTPWQSVRRPTPPPALQRTRNLMQAAIEAAYHSVQDDALVIDTDLLPSYWHYQQEGTRMIPAREFIGIPESLVSEAEELLADDVLEKMLPPFA